MFIDKTWLAENFLDPVYLKQSDSVSSYTNDMISAFLDATLALFIINIVSAAVWHTSSGLCQIYGPGEAARLLWMWLVALLIGLLISCGLVYWYVVVDTSNLVPTDAMFKVYGVTIVLFVLSYYIGTCFPTAPKLRPAVPLARFLPAA